MPSKYAEIMDAISVRIRRGDYHGTSLPSEKVLATEFGVSYMTARRAVQGLIAAGLLRRQGNARLAMPGRSVRPRIQLAFAMPASTMRHLGDWIKSIEVVAEENEATLRLIPYLDSDDPALLEALGSQYSGTFLMAAHPMRELMAARIRSISDRVVTLFDRFPDWRVPSLDDSSLTGVTLLVAHLAERGHRRIDSINAEKMRPMTQDSIQTWEKALTDLGLEGHHHEFSDLDHGLSEMRAYLGAKSLLARRDRPTALLSTSVAAARGLYRAAYEHHLQVGRDISICARGSQARARLMTPSLTCLVLPEREPYIRQALKWMLSKSSRPPQHGFRPKSAALHEGESCATFSPSV